VKLSDELRDFVNNIAWPNLDSERMITDESGEEYFESEYVANRLVGQVEKLEEERNRLNFRLSYWKEKAIKLEEENRELRLINQKQLENIENLKAEIYQLKLANRNVNYDSSLREEGGDAK
jgi:hypothetical protein